MEKEENEFKYFQIFLWEQKNKYKLKKKDLVLGGMLES